MPLATLALTLLGPCVLGFVPRAAALLLPAAALAALLADGPAIAAPGIALALACGLVLRLAMWRGAPAAWVALLWAALAALPVVAPAASRSLASASRPAADAWIWALWPPAHLPAAGWDPALRPPLYEDWGSRAALPPPEPGLALAAAAGLAAALYFLPGSGRGPDRKEDPTSP